MQEIESSVAGSPLELLGQENRIQPLVRPVMLQQPSFTKDVQKRSSNDIYGSYNSVLCCPVCCALLYETVMTRRTAIERRFTICKIPSAILSRI